MLLDCRPVPEPSAIEIRTASGSIRAGQLDYAEEFVKTIAKAEDSLKLLENQRVLETQRSADYTFLIHFESAAYFFDYFEYWASYYEPLPESLIQKIKELSAHPGTEIILDTSCKGTVFKKLI